MKKKIILTICLLISITFFSGMTYSFFNSSANMKSTNQSIANFIFETEKVDYIELGINEFLPGDKKEFLFSVTNALEEKTSDVTIEYQLLIKTYHFIPTIINLYSIVDEKEELIATCDEPINRDSENKVVCKLPIETLEKGKVMKDDYKLEVIFPVEYNDVIYSELVDYINIDIESWQKL